MLFKPKILKNTRDYFPYIGHTLDKEFIENVRTYSLRPKIKGKKIKDIFYGLNIDDYVLDSERKDTKIYPSNSSLFNTITTKGFSEAKKIADDPNSVMIITPRHRSLIDFIAAQPMHFFHVNNDVMLAAGDNLFVSYFDDFLRNFGAFMFLRPHKSGKVFNRFSNNPIKLKKSFYLARVLKDYLRQEMIESNYDMILFPESELRKTQISLTKTMLLPHSGRTKDGLVKEVTDLFPKIMAKIAKNSNKNIYFVPANISFSKYVDALFLENDSLASKIRKPFKYLFELNYVFNRYPHFAEINDNAKLDVTITYDKPILLEGNGIGINEKIKEGMIRSETIYPSTLLYRVMDSLNEIEFFELEDRINCLIDDYQEKGIDVSNVTDKGNPYSGEYLAVLARSQMNTNPRLFLHSRNSSTNLLELTKDSIKSNNSRIQSWYKNNLVDIISLK